MGTDKRLSGTLCLNRNEENNRFWLGEGSKPGGSVKLVKHYAGTKQLKQLPPPPFPSKKSGKLVLEQRVSQNVLFLILLLFHYTNKSDKWRSLCYYFVMENFQVYWIILIQNQQYLDPGSLSCYLTRGSILGQVTVSR